MKKKHLLMFVTIIAVLGIFFACTQPGDEGGTTPATYTATYDGNGNTGGTVPTDSNTYEQGANVTVLDNTGSLVRIPAAGTGEAFKEVDGWNTQADGNGTDYVASDTFSMGNADITLYAKWVAFELRDDGPAGGLIFYDKGSYLAGWRYLEAAPLSTEWGSVVLWSDPDASLIGTNTGIGEGQANTTAIVTALSGESGRAAQVCDGLSDVGGYSDWFLPSKDELNEMYVNLKSEAVGGFAANYYWSSSEDGAGDAWIQYFGSGFQYNSSKDFTNYVRAVRAF